MRTSVRMRPRMSAQHKQERGHARQSMTLWGTAFYKKENKQEEQSRVIKDRQCKTKYRTSYLDSPHRKHFFSRAHTAEHLILKVTQRTCYLKSPHSGKSYLKSPHSEHFILRAHTENNFSWEPTQQKNLSWERIFHLVSPHRENFILKAHTENHWLARLSVSSRFRD